LKAGVAALAAAAALACQRAPEPCPALVSDGQYEMGTVLEIQLCAPDRASGEHLLASAFEKVSALEHAFSTFDPESEVSRLNRSAGSGPREVSLDLLRLSAESLVLADQTQRSFDPTVGPLVALWREAGRAGRLPSAAALADARARTGFDAVQADLTAKTIELRVAGASLDFGGIAKGWALDRLVEDLRAAGVTRALLSFGDSSVAALGAPPDAEGWGLALGGATGGVAGTVLLRDQSLSVSGSLGQFVEIEGRRYGHVIDPRSGAPLERAQVAAVLAGDGARAEAFSKALLILGEHDGVALLETFPDAQGILLDADGHAFETRGWREASRYLPESPTSAALRPIHGRLPKESSDTTSPTGRRVVGP
jgi:FAD:protein FMN transferase